MTSHRQNTGMSTSNAFRKSAQLVGSLWPGSRYCIAYHRHRGIDLLFPRRGAVWLPHSVFVCDDLAVEVGVCSRIVPAHGSHWCASVSANARIARSSWMGLALVVSAVCPCDRRLDWFLKNTGNNVLFFLLNLLRLTNIY